MPIAKKVIKHLEDNKVQYEVIEHRTVFTAFDAAATMKRDLREVMKILLVKTDKPLYGRQKGFVLVALAANATSTSKNCSRQSMPTMSKQRQKLRK